MEMVAPRLMEPAMWQVPVIGRLATRLMHRRGSTDKMDAETRRLLDKVLNYAAVAEQTIAAQQQRIAYLESLSETDELTDLPNRRGLGRFLARTLGTCRRHDEEAVLAIIDLDGFKQLNDTYGHAAGDAMLAAVAQVLKSAIRSHDLAARLGGDEFAVVLTRCTAAQGYARMLEIQHMIERTTIRYAGDDARVGASIGIEPFTGQDDPEALMQRADAAMYHDKARRKEG